jgi:hypothetical protein
MLIRAQHFGWSLGLQVALGLAVTSASAESPSPASEATGSRTGPATSDPDTRESTNREPTGHEQTNREPTGHEQSFSHSGVSMPVALDTRVAPVVVQKEVQIILELVLDETGAVTQVTLITGPEPLASDVQRQALAWKFRPAYRGSQPTSARIQFLVRFTPEPETPPPPVLEGADGQPADTSANPNAGPPPRSPSVPRAERMSEIVVVGKSQDPASTRLTRAEVQNIAGAFGDPLRAIDVMPGVTPIATGLPLFFVRGAPPGNVGYFIDGIRIPLLYHGFLGPSVIHPAFIEDVTLNAGPMPVRFGRFAGASVEAGLAEPRQSFRAEASVRLFDAGAFVEAPFAEGRGYVMVGGRYSFTALLVSLLSPGIQAEYWDYQAMAGYRFSKRDEIRIFGFGAYDFFTGGTDNLGGTEFHRVDARYRHEFDSKTNLIIGASTGRDRTRSTAGYLGDTVILSRARFEHDADWGKLRIGGDLSVDNYDSLIDKTVPEPEVYEELFPARTDVSGGMYVDTVLFPKGRIRVTPGVRVDVFSSLGDVIAAVDPRIFAEFQVTKGVRVVQGLGLAHQSPNFVPNVPGAQVGGLEGGLQESLQAESRLEVELPWEVKGTLTGFINGTQRLSDPIGLNQTLSIDETSKTDRAFGRAMGIEIMLHRPLTRRLGGIVSYTLMSTHRGYDNISTVSGYDRPNMLNLALTYDFGGHVRGSAKMSLAEGIPGRRTTEDGFVFDGSRSVPLFRLDLKLEKRWYLTETTYLGANVEVLNATYSPNVARRTCGVNGCVDQGTAPLILPSIGVEFGWR